MIKFQEEVVAGHSTGVAYLDSNRGFHLRKIIGKVNSFLNKYPDFPSTDDCLGHSRYASVGAITIENQHPIPVIVKGKTIGYGVHNGTWSDYTSFE
jgi:glucosamine 6-phosphate synthetase-like amidotransferase/phosphosugar isomerase protein